MENICQTIVRKLINLANLNVEDDDLEIYTYGLFSFINTIIPSACLLFFALIIDRQFEILFWIFCFLTFRKFSGGFHSKTPFRCFLSSILLGISALIIGSKINLSIVIHYLLLVICNLTPLIILAPVTAKYLSNKRRQLCKLKLGLIISTLTIILYFIPSLQGYFLHALFSTTTLCIAEKMKK